jgi:hypothetical protein
MAPLAEDAEIERKMEKLFKALKKGKKVEYDILKLFRESLSKSLDHFRKQRV